MQKRAIAAVNAVVFCTLLNLAAFAQDINPLKEQVDPNFDPDQRAFYHARVIKIPTPRWTACTAPTWYTP